MDKTQLPPHIFGMHDSGAEHLFAESGKRAWIVITVQATDSPPGDFSGLANQGHGIIIRLNNGYGSAGTIPFSSQYDAFAQACGNYAAGSRGAHIWIIGNETNLQSERPGSGDAAREEAITPARYARCFAKCRAAIKNAAGHGDDWVVPSPPGPWNNQTAYPGNEAGDWVIYFRDLLNECVKQGATPDALALHTYTHEAPMNAALVEDEGRFTNPPFTERHFQFRAYRDFLSVVPAKLATLPVFITESQALPWEDRNAGWIQKAYAEIDAWNAVPTNQPIQALVLFRWTANPGDETQRGWSISDRRRLQDDLRAALQNDFRVRWVGPAVTPAPAPSPKPAPAPVGGLLPLDKVRWFTEEAIRKLEAVDGKAARELIVNTITPWFYASYPLHSADLAKAQAHTTARWNTEQATRQIEANDLTGARQTLLDNVLAWLASPGPRALGILSVKAAPVPVKQSKSARKSAKKSRGRKRAAPRPGVLSIEETPSVSTLSVETLEELLLREGDARQVLPFNREAALQRAIFAAGLVPNSAEFNLTVADASYVAQRAEHLLTGEVRVYFAPTTNFANVSFVGQSEGAGLNTPFKGGNRITQVFAARPEYYQQFRLSGHEGVDLVPKDADLEIHCVEGGKIIKDVNVPADSKAPVYGNHVVVFNAENRRLWYYCHMSENRVNENDMVQRGDVLGRMGSSGNTQGAHLHLNLKLLDASSLPLTPQNGFLGYSDPLPLVNTLNAAPAASAPLREALLKQANASQSIAFNTKAALQKQMFADGFLPNSQEFNLSQDGVPYVAQRGEDIKTGAVRVYYAPTTNFAAIKFVERS